MNYTVRFKIAPDADIVYSSPSGLTVMEAARQAGLDLDSPCAGNGSCGKCLVSVVTAGKEEQRLACQTKIESDLTVIVPRNLLVSNSKIKTIDPNDEKEQRIFENLQNQLEELGFTGDSGLELVTLKLKEPAIDDPMADSERLLAGLHNAMEISLHALRKLPGVLRQNNFSLTCVLDRSCGVLKVIDLMPTNGEAACKPLLTGLAIDIGTTTVAALLVDLSSGKVLASGTRANPQIPYGADVISRIIASTRPGGLELLRRAIVDECLSPLIQEMARKAGIETCQIYKAAVAANTTMTHLFTGVPPEHLRLEPYVPAFFRANGINAFDLGLHIHPEASVLIAPSVGSYVGGDISAGLFASMLFKKDTLSLFIDLGTNGELVLGSKDFLVACACSAGPAFEGGDISSGMRAAEGAIDSVRIDRKSLEPVLTVIGKGKPWGICGSGLIDLVSEFFTCGIIDSRGKFDFTHNAEKQPGVIRKRLHKDEYGMGRYILAFAEETENQKELFISEADIDNFIRAKGAIFSAIRTMLAILNSSMNDIENVFIAGGIGSGINMQNAISIGMLPNIPLERYHYIGNSALAGAYAMLKSQKAAQKIDEIAANMTYLELSSHPSYMDEFVAACFLPHTNSNLFSIAPNANTRACT